MADKNGLVLKNFAGGWVTEIKSDTLLPSMSPDLENVDFNTGGSVKKTGGRSELGSDSDTGVSTDLMIVPDRSGVEWLFKKQDTKFKIYDEVNGIYNTIRTGLTAGDRLGHEYFDTILYCLSKVDTGFTVDLSKITRLNGALAGGETTITVVSNASLPASGTVWINGVPVTYSGKSGLTQLTGCSGAIATPDTYLVVNALTSLTSLAAIVKGNITSFFVGRLWIASGSNSIVYASKLLDFTNFTVAGSGVGDALQTTMESRINALRVFYDDQNNLRIMAFAANNKIFTMDVDDNADLSSTILTKKVFKESVTALGQFSTVVGFNDLIHVDLNNQVRTLGQTYASQGVNKVYSDNVSENHRTLFKNSYNFESSYGIINDDEYWNICREGDGNINNRVIIFHLVKKTWKRRTDINANDIKVFNNQIVFTDASENKVYVLDGSNSNDEQPIRFKYSTLDIAQNPLDFQRLRSVRIMGFISENAEVPVKIYKDFGTVLIGEFLIRGNNNEITGALLDGKGVFGGVMFGDEVFGGEGSDTNYRFFVAQLDIKVLPDSMNHRIVVENNQANVYFEMTGLKPFIMPLDENYFKPEKILTPN